MNILLTGGDGYIGGHLKPYLEDNGHYIELYDGNILDFEIDTYGCHEMVIHLAALAGVKESMEKPEEYYEVNVKGFGKVLHDCRIKRVKLLYASSSSAAEWWTSPYAITKKINEEMASPTNFIGFRPHTVYPGRPDMLYSQLKRDPKSIKYINRYHTRDFTHIEDLCSGILTLVENYDIIEDKVVDIGTGHSISVLVLARMMGWDGEVRGEPTPNESINTKADTTTLRKLGWEPKHTIL